MTAPSQLQPRSKQPIEQGHVTMWRSGRSGVVNTKCSEPDSLVGVGISHQEHRDEAHLNKQLDVN